MSWAATEWRRFSVTTDAAGHAQLAKFPIGQREKSPETILVQKDNDFSFLPLQSNGRNLDLSRFDTGGVVNANRPGAIRLPVFRSRDLPAGRNRAPGRHWCAPAIGKPGWPAPVHVDLTDSSRRDSQPHRPQLSLTALKKCSGPAAPALQRDYRRRRFW